MRREPILEVFAGVQRTEWSHVLFPIDLPRGGVLRHYYTGSIVAIAPGPTAIRVSGSLPARQSSPYFENTDRFTVYLPRKSP